MNDPDGISARLDPRPIVLGLPQKQFVSAFGKKRHDVKIADLPVDVILRLKRKFSDISEKDLT